MKKIVALVLSLVMVLGLATTAFAAAETKLYKQQDNNTTEWMECETFAGKVPADFVVDADYDFATGGNLEYYALGDAGNFVEATKETGEYKLVCGNVTVYLNADTTGAPFYRYEAEAFAGLTTDEDACGNLLVTKKNLAKVYYVVENDKGIPVAYFVKATAGETALLVDGKVVKADAVDSFITHEWVGNETNAVTKAYTSLVCENCGKVAKLYANADAAGKYAQYEAPYGWITAADAGYDVVAEAPAAGETVESAKTFDAGIAMYVGMSVMAAAGSAVVLKKKD